MTSGNDGNAHSLPQDYAYLQSVLEKCTLANGSTDDYRILVSDLSPEQIDEIATAYRELAKREDIHRLSAWLKARDDEFEDAREKDRGRREERSNRILGGEDLPPDIDAPIPVRGLELFKLFEALARKNIPPFHLREIVYSPPPVKLDWSKLPESLQYLRGPAMEYGHLIFHADRKRFKRQMTEEQRQELLTLAQRVQSSGDGKTLLEWSREHSGRRHPESSLINWAMALAYEVEADSSRPVAPPSELNWKRLPGSLRFLEVFAEEYGRHTTPQARAALIGEMRARETKSGKPDQDLAQLKEIAALIDATYQRKTQDWLRRYPPDQHKEAALVQSFLLLLKEQF